MKMSSLQVLLLIVCLMKGMCANEASDGSGSGDTLSVGVMPMSSFVSPPPLTPTISLPATPTSPKSTMQPAASSSVPLLGPYSPSVNFMSSSTAIPFMTTLPSSFEPLTSSTSQQITATSLAISATTIFSPEITLSTISPSDSAVVTTPTLDPSIFPDLPTSTPSQLLPSLPSPTPTIPSLLHTPLASQTPLNLPYTPTTPTITTSAPAAPTILVAETTTPIPAAALTMTHIIIIAAVGGVLLVGVIIVLLCCVVLVRRKKRSDRFVFTTAGSSSNVFPMYKGGELGIDQPDVLASPPVQEGIINFGVNLTTNTFGIESLPTSPDKAETAATDENLPALVFINAVDPTIPIVSNTNYSHTLPTKKKFQRSDFLQASFETPAGGSASRDLESSFDVELKASKSTGAINVTIDSQSLSKNPQLDDFTGQKANKACVQPQLPHDAKKTETPENISTFTAKARENDGYVFLEPLGKSSEPHGPTPTLSIPSSQQKPEMSKFATESLYDVPRAAIRAKVGGGGDEAPKAGESVFLPTPDTSHYDVPRKLLAGLKKESKSEITPSTFAPSATAAAPKSPGTLNTLHENTAPNTSVPAPATPSDTTSSPAPAAPSDATNVPPPAMPSDTTSAPPLMGSEETPTQAAKTEKDSVSSPSATPQPVTTPTMLQEKLASKPKKPVVPTRKASLDKISVADKDNTITKLLETANPLKSGVPPKALVEESGGNGSNSADISHPVAKKRGETSPVSSSKHHEGGEDGGKGNAQDLRRKDKAPDKVVEVEKAPKSSGDGALNSKQSPKKQVVEKPKLKPKPSAKILQEREASPLSESSNAKPPKKSGHAPLTRELAISLTEK